MRGYIPPVASERKQGVVRDRVDDLKDVGGPVLNRRVDGSICAVDDAVHGDEPTVALARSALTFRFIIFDPDRPYPCQPNIVE